MRSSPLFHTLFPLMNTATGSWITTKGLSFQLHVELVVGIRCIGSGLEYDALFFISVLQGQKKRPGLTQRSLPSSLSLPPAPR